MSQLFKKGLIILMITPFVYCTNRSEVTVIIKPSFEECDDYKLIWKIDSIIRGNEEILNKQIYLLNSKKTYSEKDSNIQYVLKGVYTDNLIKEDFTLCGDVYRFYDDSISNWREGKIKEGRSGASVRMIKSKR